MPSEYGSDGELIGRASPGPGPLEEARAAAPGTDPREAAP